MARWVTQTKYTSLFPPYIHTNQAILLLLSLLCYKLRLKRKEKGNVKKGNE